MSLERTDPPTRSGKACESCRAWEPVQPLRIGGRDVPEIREGRCRRLPPIGGAWPRTTATDWCWDYMPTFGSSAAPTERT